VTHSLHPKIHADPDPGNDPLSQPTLLASKARRYGRRPEYKYEMTKRMRQHYLSYNQKAMDRARNAK
jgi:hypothetical protein